jgi:predicted RND superfamily exporter protein
MNKPIDNSLEHHLLHPVEDVEPFLERLFFNNRRIVVLLFLLVTAFLSFQAVKIRPDASFIKMIPTYHPYIANYLDNREDLSGLGNAVRISVETTEGDIFTEAFQRTLMEVNDAVFFLPGVDRTGLKSIWTPRVRWTEVTEEGFVGGPVIPNNYDGSAQSLEQLRTNVLRSGQVGSLVANDFRSAIIYAPLFDVDPKTGERLDYQLLSEKLENDIREKFQNDKVKIHITGFAKVVGELINGASEVALFFVVALLITMVMLYLYSRCLLSTLIPLLCSVVAVIWQLGILQSLGMGLDPYSMLVPFLVFAIGVSHGVQIINSIAHERMKGADKRRAAQLTFRSLYIPGLTALFSDGIGFITLMVIQIEVIQDLAVAASIGVAVIILTNLVLLPLLMSFTGISESAVRSLEVKESGSHPVWRFLSGFTQPGLARTTVVIAVLASATGLYLSKDLKIGDLDAGAPELHPTSVYNRDNAFIVKNYSASTDVFVVMVKTTPDACLDYDTFAAVDRFQWHMENVPGVQFATSLVSVSKRVLSGLNEGSLKWQALNRNQAMLNNSVATAPQGLMNTDCSMLPVMVFLNDHKAETLERVVAAAQAFADDNNNDELEFVIRDAFVGLCRCQPSVPDYLPLAAYCGLYHSAIAGYFDSLPGSDGSDGDGGQGRHVTGDRAGCWYRS